MDGIRLEPAGQGDCRVIAALFRISSEGIADHVWSGLAAPGEDPLAVGARRYAREDAPLSWRSALLARAGEEVVGMAVAYPQLQATPPEVVATLDPVLRPYAALELAPSYYLAGLALFPPWRGQGIGGRLLDAVHARARAHGLERVSLMVFAANEGAVRFYRRRGYREAGRGTIVPHPLIRARGEVLLLAAPA